MSNGIQNIQPVILGQDAYVSVNNSEPTKFKVIKSDNGIIHLSTYKPLNSPFFIAIHLAPPMPPEGEIKKDGIE